ncbi:MAG: translation initiation factor IF-2 [Dehalococcoidia bacterium]|nr:translation initiation factor IF-2 [Dehalococcoidia bacterium]MDD5493506.1 translation initiation factor IF-2 [Dehalococcoidia bacterium]
MTNKPENDHNQVDNGLKPGASQPAYQQITLPPIITVKQLADMINVSPIEVIKQLMRNGIMANINQALEYEVASGVVSDFGFTAKRQRTSAAAKQAVTAGAGKLHTRPPVITIMGHVDHGKTSLLDAIRKSNVADGEAGAITQHIGAYQVEMKGRKITFLDTPGHEAFTAMRARGARATDIAVLVVAADDGVMPQTIEALDHAKAAGVSIVVALNKIDKPGANPDKVKQQLADQGILIEEWGGDIICVPVSAKKKLGIDDLLENLLLVADILELKAEWDCPAEGIVIEARLDKSRGSIATVLVQKGVLKPGDNIVAGVIGGKVKAMFNDTGKNIRKAEPATPAGILGLNSVPAAGEVFQVVADEKEARALIEKNKEERAATKGVSLTSIASQTAAGETKDLNIILKTDVHGSIEPIKDSLEHLSDEKTRVKVIHTGTGSITESDILLALASKAVVVGFNSKPEPGASRMAELENINIRQYSVIYKLVEDVEKALQGLLEPEYAEVVIGQAEIKAVFEAGKRGKIAGCLLREGKATRDSQVRVLRANKTIAESRVSSLKRFKDDVKEVAAGMECGVKLDSFNDFQIGDILQFFRQEQVI